MVKEVLPVGFGTARLSLVVAFVLHDFCDQTTVLFPSEVFCVLKQDFLGSAHPGFKGSGPWVSLNS